MTATSSEPPLIELRDVTVFSHTRTRPLLYAVSLRIDVGRSVAVVGPSGAGKSTLARTLVGLVDAAAGELHWQGRVLPWGDDRQWLPLRRRVRSCWQISDMAFDPRHRLRHAIALAGQLAEQEMADVTRRAERWCDALALDRELLERVPSALSGGELQRMGLVRALATEPELVIADEITDALDGDNRFRVLEALAAERERGMALVVVTHELAVVRRLADEVVVIDEGRVVETGASDRVLADPQHATTRAWLEAASTSAV